MLANSIDNAYEGTLSHCPQTVIESLLLRSVAVYFNFTSSILIQTMPACGDERAIGGIRESALVWQIGSLALYLLDIL